MGDRQQSPRQVPPVGIFGKGRGVERGGGLKIGARLPNPPQAQSSLQRTAAAAHARTHAHTLAHNRHAHAIGTTHSCCVIVMSFVSSQSAGRTRTEQYGCARYSQLIRIIECQACGTEGTEWRRRGLLSLCVRPPSPCAAWATLCSLLCPYLCLRLCSSTCLS